MNVPSCLSWISYVCDELSGMLIRKKSGRTVPCLPDHIIVNILSRLPAEHVLECRSVCRLWKALTSTTEFVDLHLKRSPPTLISQVTLSNKFCFGKLEVEQNELRSIEEWTRGPRRDNLKSKKFPFGPLNMPVGGRESFSVLIFSYKGLIVFSRKYSSEQTPFAVCNPITGKILTLNAEGTVCGIFCHPVTGEFMVLCFRQPVTEMFSYQPAKDEMFSYKICSLKPQSSWKHVADLPYLPRLSTCVISNESLHWIVKENINVEDDERSFYICESKSPRCSECILVFNILTESFSVMSHPGVSCDSLSSAYIRSTAHFRRNSFDSYEDGPLAASGTRHHQMELVEIRKGQLALSDFDIAEQKLEIWLLDDYANWCWKKGYELRLEMELERAPFEQGENVIPLGVVDGELFIHWKGRGLLGCRLEQHSIKRYRWLESDGYHIEQAPIGLLWPDSYYETNLLLYTGSLVSLPML